MKITFEEAKEKFKDRKDIELIKDGYNGWCKRSKFWDNELNEEFWSVPFSVFKNKSGNPKTKGRRAHDKRKITFEVARQKFIDQGRDDIELIEKGFKGWKKKSLFLHKELNKTWAAVPLSVFKNRSTHRTIAIRNKKEAYKEKYGFDYPFQHKNPRKLTFEEVKQKFVEQGRTDIELIEEGFKGWGEKSLILDKEVNETFSIEPKILFRINAVHSKRRTQKRKETCKERYNVENVFQVEEFKEKQRQINKEKYGKEYYFQTEEYKEKSKQTNMEKRGVEYAAQCPEVREKQKQTCLERHGVENPSQSEEIKIKKSETLFKNYGVYKIGDSQELCRKREEIIFERHGVRNPYQISHIREKALNSISDRFIEETGEHLRSWWTKLSEPKPGYTTIKIFFNKKEKILLYELENYIKRYVEHKSSLEIFTENLFNIKHYNRKPKEINKFYKPDFKLNETIYLNTDGLYWHTQKLKGKWYHLNLRKEFEDNRLRIFQFYDYEIYNKTNIVRSIVNSAQNIFENKILAVDCDIKEFSSVPALNFLNQNHLMGETEENDVYHIGLYRKQEFVSVLSYKIRTNICQILRFCNKNHYNVENSFNLILSELEKKLLSKNINKIYTIVNLRYDYGDQLLDGGFIKKKDMLKINWTDHRCLFSNKPKNISTLNKIYDAGQRLYVKNLIKKHRKNN